MLKKQKRIFNELKNLFERDGIYKIDEKILILCTKPFIEEKYNILCELK